MQETGFVVQKEHNLEKLLDKLLPHHGMLASLRRSLRSLTPFAVNFRYPGVRATMRRMQAALRQAEHVRTALRARLALSPGLLTGLKTNLAWRQTLRVWFVFHPWLKIPAASTWLRRLPAA